ncbi:MBL fold metallo-hydrolase [Arthrobacter sp. AQ5-05]|uniref:MBL fold metallo-hydrolase n=1 Tax=Arthrobacter sp. AQ5-05 TaxID=2184581 RepID=UPI000DCEF631|nr:MBL fold metallo-hydrolase [Arthrobacter sp. AQ5-05]RAX50074.1 MBL fold metallo-hydrolase [Arthrobacter sp. AQ5-05]
MEITKFNHSCIRVSSGGRSLVIDPGTFSPLELALQGAEAILATHVHADHLDLDAVVAAMGREKQLAFHGPAALAASLLAAATEAGVADAAARIHGTGPGEHFEAAGMEISTHGGMHAVIHHSLPVVANIGYFVDRTLYHPGDSYQVPEGIEVETLLVPAHAPWAKIGETIEFLSMVNAADNIPIHDGLLNARGLSLVDGHLGRVAAEHGLGYRRIPNGTPVVLGER